MGEVREEVQPCSLSVRTEEVVEVFQQPNWPQKTVLTMALEAVSSNLPTDSVLLVQILLKAE